MLEGLGADRDFTNPEQKVLIYSGTSIHPVVAESDSLTLAITNNYVGSAALEIALYYALGY